MLIIVLQNVLVTMKTLFYTYSDILDYFIQSRTFQKFKLFKFLTSSRIVSNIVKVLMYNNVHLVLSTIFEALFDTMAVLEHSNFLNCTIYASFYLNGI